MALTDTWLKAQHKKSHEKAVEKADGEGLSARVSPMGKVVFQMRYRWCGKGARLDLGVYPRMSLREARTEHQRLKGELEQGHDPRVIRKVEIAGIETALTNKDLYLKWHVDYCLGYKSQASDVLRSFEIHVFPKLGNLPADKTSANQWLTLIERVADQAPSIAERILQNTKQMHRWANRRGLMVTKPLVDISAAEDLMIEKKESGRSLSDDEIRLVWYSADRSRMAPANKLFIKLCLFFGCRNGELRSMNPLMDLDFEAMAWTIPPEKNKVRRKVRKAIVRPLIPEIVPYLKEAIRLSGSRQLLITQDGQPVSLSSSAVLSLPGNVMRNAKKHYGEDMLHWSMHDLRKTARTNFSSLTQVHVAEVMLGHSLKGMQGVYDRHLYMGEQAAAYEAWWKRLMAIVEVPPERKFEAV